jgi:hypothetical protein
MLKSTPSLVNNLKRLLVFFLLLAPMGLFLPFLDRFPFPIGSLYSDFTISHFPNTVFLADSLRQFGELPLWSNQILSGYPFAANPLSGMWYPFSWPGLFLTQPAGMNLMILGHLLVGGIGIFLLLKGDGRSFPASLAGAYVFELSPKLMAHFAAGHVTLIYAVCLTPWLLLAGKWDLNGRWRFSSGMVLGLLALADIRWAPMAGILWLGFCCYTALTKRILDPKRMPIFIKLGLNILIGLGIAAPLLLPLTEYSNLSTRSWLTSAENLAFSLPVPRLFGLVVPDLGGYAEWALYPGIVATVVVLWAMTTRKFWKENLFWVVGFLIVILFSLGDNLPFAGVLTLLPGMNLLRVPARSLFMISLFFSFFLAWGMDASAGFVKRTKEEKRSGNLLLPFGFVLFGICICAGLWFLTGSVPLNFSFAFGFATISLILIYIFTFAKINFKVFSLVMIGAIVLELGLMANLTIDFRKADPVLEGKSQMVDWIERQKTGAPFRIYSPSYSMPQQVAAIHHFELVDGIDPLQLAGYQRFIEEASGIKNQAYSVTLPPFASGRPELDNINSVPNSHLLGLLNVRYILAEYDLPQSGLFLAARFENTRIYENPAFYPRAWVENPENLAERLSVWLKYESPNRIEIEASGPGRLVLSEIFYPGWKAVVDGKSVTIEPAHGILRSVSLQPGAHTVSFVYQPVLMWIGLGLALLSWICVAGTCMVSKKYANKS